MRNNNYRSLVAFSILAKGVTWTTISVVRLITLLSGLFFSLVLHGAEFTLDWDKETWSPTGSLAQSYTLGTGDVKFTVSGETGAMALGSPIVNKVNTGGLPLDEAENSVLLAVNYDSPTPASEQKITINIDFTHPEGVSNISFKLFDIDNGSPVGNEPLFSDQVTVTASGSSDGSGSFSPSQVDHGAANTFDGEDTVTGVGLSAPINDDSGNTTFTFNQSGIKHITIVYRDPLGVENDGGTPSAPGNPGDPESDLQFISLHDIKFEAPAPDLSITKEHEGDDFQIGQNAVYTLTVRNEPEADAETGPIEVTDQLPEGLELVSAEGDGWTCDASGQDVTCTHPGPLAPGASLDPITLTAKVDALAAPEVTNTATVSGSRGDADLSNNTDTDTANIIDKLRLRKLASREQVSVGDFVQYTVEMINDLNPNTLINTTVTDVLPAGFRYQFGSARLDDTKIDDPVVSDDGRTLRFDVGDVDAGRTTKLRYVLEVTPGASTGFALNLATAEDETGAKSNTAQARVRVEEDLFANRSFVVGRVMSGNCTALEESKGYMHLRLQSWVTGDKFDQSLTVYGEHVRTQNLTAVVELPPALHYVPGSVLLDGKSAAEPEIRGQRLLFSLGDNNKHVYHTLQYRASVDGSVAGQFSTQAYASFDTPSKTNQTTPAVENSFKSRQAGTENSGLVQALQGDSGRVSVYTFGDAQQPTQPSVGTDLPGIAGIRLLLEDGRYVVTDEQGLYHFEGLQPGTHVVQIDPGSVPKHLEILECEQNTRFAGNPYSQFVDTQGGTLWRADFYVKEKPPQAGMVNLRLKSKLEGELVDSSVTLSGDTHPYNNLRLNVALPNGLEYIPGSSTLDEESIEDPDHSEGALNYHLGAPPQASWTRQLRFKARLKQPQEEFSTYATLTFDTANSRNKRTPVAINTFVSKPPKASEPAEPILRDSGLKTVEIKERMQPFTAKLPEVPVKGNNDIEKYNSSWLDTSPPGLMWLSPTADYNPQEPTVKIAIKHPANQSLELWHNEEFIGTPDADGLAKSQDGRQAVSVWQNVALTKGSNRFDIRALNSRGEAIDQIVQVIHYAGSPQQAELVKAYSQRIADGQAPVVIAVRILDQWGNPVRKGVVGQYQVNTPYRAKQTTEALKRQPLSGQVRAEATYTVGHDGVALIELEPTTQAGKVSLGFKFSGQRRQRVETWLQPEARDWILVGLAEGTAGYNSLSGNSEALASNEQEDGFYQDGRLAFYAKGRVKGKWLLSMAYDSTKREVQRNASLFQTLDPEEFYTLYGDATEQRFGAPSAKKLYVRLEREQFYALFGDFETGMTVTELSRYNRSMTGFKTEFEGEHLGVNAFAAETDQAFVRDEIRGNGTSGLYRLSRKNIVINSDKITLETRDRFRPQIILEKRELRRFLDYSFDAINGTVFFKQPVPSKDEHFNPIYIVVDYEVINGDKDWTGGGRGHVKLMEDRLEIGLSGVRQGDTGSGGHLIGGDLTYQLTDQTEFKAEIATSDATKDAVDTSANAYLAELTHRGERTDARVYYRNQQDDFGLDQQSTSNDNTRRYGADGRYRFTEHVDFNGEAYHDQVLSTGNKRDVVAGQAEYHQDKYTVSTGLRYARDKLGDGKLNESKLATAGASRRFLERRLKLRADAEVAVDGNKSVDFPTRFILGGDYLLNPEIKVFAEQEYTDGDAQDSHATRIGFRSSPWHLASVNSSLEQQVTEHGPRLFSNLGFTQGFQVNDRLLIDFGLDRTKTLRDPGGVRFNPDVPLSSGTLSSDFTAVSTGANYTQKRWSASSRVEYRTGEEDIQRGLFLGVYRQQTPGLGLSMGAQVFDNDVREGDDVITSDLRFSVAYRPVKSHWIVLDRLDLKHENREEQTSTLRTDKLVNNLNVNYLPSRRHQIGMHYGFKYTLDNIDGTDYDSVIEVFGGEYRYDLTKYWDMGFHGSVLNSTNARNFKYSAGPSVGVSLFKNLWLSVGYNIDGFEDEDFSAAGYTAQGPYVKMRFKLDTQSTKDMLAWWDRGT